MKESHLLGKTMALFHVFQTFSNIRLCLMIVKIFYRSIIESPEARETARQSHAIRKPLEYPPIAKTLFEI